MADGVNTLVDPVQPASLQATRYSVWCQPNGSELSGRHDTVLSRCDSGYRQVDRGAFVSHTEIKAPRAKIRPFD